MTTVLFFILFFIVLICLLWRLTSARYLIPWPHWLAWMLENPYMLIVSNSKILVNRLKLEPGMVIADFGCGAGRVLVPAAIIIGEKGIAHGFDLQEKMLLKTQKRSEMNNAKNIVLFKTELKKDILSSELYDRAFMVTVLGEVPERQQFIGEIFKGLKPGGVFSITEVIPDPCYLTSSQVKNMCLSAGFTLDHIWHSPLAYTANFIKPFK